MREPGGPQVPEADSAAPTPRLVPIGFVRSGLASKVDAPRQPAAAAGQRARIELVTGRNLEHAVDDLEGWEYLWVIFWFHLNEGWRPKVLPPRSTTGRKGVLATRSPHRPNPLGLSAVRLERVEGLTLHVAGADMVDGTPVLDIKPYVAYTDAHPAARSGWLDDESQRGAAVRPADPVADWRVEFEPRAAEQAAWIEQRTGLPLAQRIAQALAEGPRPNPYRRIKREADGYRIAIKDWRARFVVDGRRIRVLELRSGYRASQLASVQGPATALHREFIALWPDRGA